MKWFYLCVIQFKLYAIIPIIITADAIINNLFDGFFFIISVIKGNDLSDILLMKQILKVSKKDPEKIKL